MAIRILFGMGWLICAGLVGCGADRGTQPTTAALSAADLVQRLARARPAAAGAGATSTLPIDPTALFNWAQMRYPSLFPAGPVNVTLQYQGVDYTLRAYSNGNHLGITPDGEVYGLGPFTGQEVQYQGRISEFTPMMQGELCALPAADCSVTDRALRALLATNGLGGDPAAGRTLPSIDDPLPQLGKLLFFSKALAIDGDSACASCHHPSLGGADRLALPIGPAAVQPDLLGPGRRRADGQLLVGRNSNTFFNAGLFDRALFWDGRIEALNPTSRSGGAAGAIRTPDSAFGSADPDAGPNLLAAQARFPVVAPTEMRGDHAAGHSDAAVRTFLAARLGNYGDGQGLLPASLWLERFRSAFDRPDGTASDLISFDNVMRAIAEYQRSATFVQNPWRRYVQGDNNAIGLAAKLGAIVFYSDVSRGGGACVQCHKGDFFTDERFHATGFPQVGPGKDSSERDDLGRQNASGASADARAFRTPSLLNVELTAPYGHAGTYARLEQVIEHYVLPHDTVRAFLAAKQWCAIEPLAATPGCGSSDTADVERNTLAALARMESLRQTQPTDAMPVINPFMGSPADTTNLVAFMKALTDPCLKDRACLARWIPRPDEAPDAFQLNAVGRAGPLH